MKFSSLAVAAALMLATPTSAAILNVGEDYQFKSTSNGVHGDWITISSANDGNTYLRDCQVGNKTPVTFTVEACLDPENTNCNDGGECISLYSKKYDQYEFLAYTDMNHWTYAELQTRFFNKSASFCVLDASTKGGKSGDIILYSPNYYQGGNAYFTNDGNGIRSSTSLTVSKSTFTPTQDFFNPDTCEQEERVEDVDVNIPEEEDEANPPPDGATTYGDPHFKTWSGDKYDFHGGCDMVLLQNPNFSNGLGMNIHIRTGIHTSWSAIESVVLQIGGNILQITGGSGSISYWINDEKKELESGNASMGDFAISFRRVNDHQSQTRVDLGNNGDAIGIETYNSFVRVNFKNKKNTSFDGSVGLLGRFPDGQKIGRDGETMFEDANEYGQEWMVRPTDRILFSDVKASDLPLHCPMPDESSRKEGLRRRLGEAAITEEEAAIACARVTNEDERDSCIFDVMATQDKDQAGSY